MEFKKLLGTRIYLELPEEPKSNLVLDEASKIELEKEKLRTYGRLKVYAVGNGVGNGVEHIVPGDEVMIDPSSAARGVVKIPLSENKEVIMVSVFDVAHVW